MSAPAMAALHRMHVPDHWAEAQATGTVGKREVTVHRYGWSDDTLQSAQAHARQRAELALGRLQAGEKLALHEGGAAGYAAITGLPIREEVVSRHGAQVVTRNGYGARCLNSPNALFADVDLPPARLHAWWVGGLSAALVPLFVLLWLLGLSWLHAALWTIAAVSVTSGLMAIGQMVAEKWRGHPDARMRRQVEHFIVTHPDWHVRIYRTPAGYRLLATHQPFAPDDDAVLAFFKAMRVDHWYAQMCATQHCFRARLSPKPWRIGFSGADSHIPGRWPVAPEHQHARRVWIERYEARSDAFAACHFIAAIGSGTVHPDIAAVVTLHDAQSRASWTGTPLA